MLGASVVTIVSLLSTTVLARLSILSSTPSGTVFRSGESLQLECTSNLPWFLCIWETPGDQLT